MIFDILNQKGHQNCILGSKVMALNRWILPIGGVAIGKGLCLACIAALFIQWLGNSDILSSKSSKYLPSQAKWARQLKGVTNIHHHIEV